MKRFFIVLSLILLSSPAWSAEAQFCAAFGGSNFNFGGTLYMILNGGLAAQTTVETRTNPAIRTAGVFKNLTVRAYVNSLNADVTLVFRTNAATGNQSVTITSATTGVFSDSTHSDTVAAGDNVGLKVDTNAASSGNITLGNVTVTFTPTAISDTMTLITSHNGNSATYNSNTTTQYFGYNSLMGFDTTEANVQVEVPAAGTLKNMYIYVASNARTTTTTVRNRINSTNGNVFIQVAAGQTGEFEDTSNTDTVAAGDLVNFSVAGGAEVTSFVFSPVKIEYVSTGRNIFLAGVATMTHGANTTRYNALTGLTAANTETNRQMRMTTPVTVSRLAVYVSANASGVAATAYIRQNATDKTLSASITALTTGWFRDTTHSVDLSSGDDVNLVTNVPVGGGNITFKGFSINGYARSQVKTFNSISTSSLKTIKGVATASIKSLDGVTF